MQCKKEENCVYFDSSKTISISVPFFWQINWHIWLLFCYTRLRADSLTSPAWQPGAIGAPHSSYYEETTGRALWEIKCSLKGLYFNNTEIVHSTLVWGDPKTKTIYHSVCLCCSGVDTFVEKICPFCARLSINNSALPFKHFLCWRGDPSAKCWVYRTPADIYGTPQRSLSLFLTYDLILLSFPLHQTSSDPSSIWAYLHTHKKSGNYLIMLLLLQYF